MHALVQQSLICCKIKYSDVAFFTTLRHLLLQRRKEMRSVMTENKMRTNDGKMEKQTQQRSCSDVSSTLEFSMTLSMQSKYDSSLTASVGFSSIPLTDCTQTQHSHQHKRTKETLSADSLDLCFYVLDLNHGSSFSFFSLSAIFSDAIYDNLKARSHTG